MVSLAISHPLRDAWVQPEHFLPEASTCQRMLHAQNASVLTLLPSLANGLLSQVSRLERVLNFIDDEVAVLRYNQQKLDRLLHIKKQLQEIEKPAHNSVVNVDAEKTLLLAYAFGEQYAPALALLTGKQISIQVWGTQLIEPTRESLDRFFISHEKDIPIFVQVSKEPVAEEKEAVMDVNPFLQLRTMLADLGLLMNLSDFTLVKADAVKTASEKASVKESICEEIGRGSEKQNEPDQASPELGINIEPQNLTCESKHDQVNRPDLENPSKVMVDLNMWYCSCLDFTKKSYVTHDKSWLDIMHSTDGSSTIAKFVQNAPCKLPATLPICKHLLAVVLLACNWTVSVDAGLVNVYWVQDEAVQVKIL
ncbi:SWIM zinc finger protein [Metschnikowia aff. pulcherrima]|uniref:SWIM zinc finger protein n=1 Tax=Metschnikowia aff. pulcherrima TaxID=2163413 RepID=A0A4P6XSQ6_9ASCO|nr:SWIM zinc finger protein [Metschnikowia aff. pulcherrima]